jgi:hypothetical protein
MNNGDTPARPTSISLNPSGDVYYGEAGLTKREHFAAMAMQGLLATGNGSNRPANTSSIALTHADALLKALEQS